MLLMLLGCCLQAHAAVTPTESVGLLRTVFSELTGAVDQFAAGNAGFISIGRRAAVALFGVLLIWGIVRSWVLGQGFAQLVPEFIQPVVMLGLTLWAVDHLGPVVKSSVEGLSSVFSETLRLPGGVPAEMDLLQSLAGAGLDIIVAKPTHGGGDWVDVLKAFAGDFQATVVRCLAALMLIAAGVLACGVMVLAKIQTAIAILFAPVMIPWAMWKPTAFLFNSWLTFLITGAMQSVMAAAMAALSVTMVEKILVLALSVRGNDVASFAVLCVILVLSTLILFLFTRVSSLSSALIGGAASLDVTRWVATSAAAGKTAVQAARLLHSMKSQPTRNTASTQQAGGASRGRGGLSGGGASRVGTDTSVNAGSDSRADPKLSSKAKP